MLTDFKTYIRFDICLRHRGGSLWRDLDIAVMDYLKTRIEWLQIQGIRTLTEDNKNYYIGFVFELNPNLELVNNRQMYYILQTLHEALFEPLYYSRTPAAELGKVGELNTIQVEPSEDYTIRVARFITCGRKNHNLIYCRHSLLSNAHNMQILSPEFICTGAAFWLDTYDTKPKFKMGSYTKVKFSNEEIAGLNRINEAARFETIKSSSDKGLARHAEYIKDLAELMRKELSLDGGE